MVYFEDQLGLLRTDLENVRRLLPDGIAPEKHPGPTNLVEGTLDDGTEEGVGIEYYSELSEVAHSGSDATNHLLNSGSTSLPPDTLLLELPLEADPASGRAAGTNSPCTHIALQVGVLPGRIAHAPT